MMLNFVLFLLLQVTEECDGLQHQVEVRYITQRISSLGEKLDSASALGEPRENAFLTCDLAADALTRLDTALATLGRVRTSTTFPSLSTVQVKGTFSFIFLAFYNSHTHTHTHTQFVMVQRHKTYTTSHQMCIRDSTRAS